MHHVGVGLVAEAADGLLLGDAALGRQDADELGAAFGAVAKIDLGGAGEFQEGRPDLRAAIASGHPGHAGPVVVNGAPLLGVRGERREEEGEEGSDEPQHGGERIVQGMRSATSLRRSRSSRVSSSASSRSRKR